MVALTARASIVLPEVDNTCRKCFHPSVGQVCALLVTHVLLCWRLLLAENLPSDPGPGRASTTANRWIVPP